MPSDEWGLTDPFLLPRWRSLSSDHKSFDHSGSNLVKNGTFSLPDGPSTVHLNSGKSLSDLSSVPGDHCEAMYNLKGSHKGDAPRFIIWGFFFCGINLCICSVCLSPQTTDFPRRARCTWVEVSSIATHDLSPLHHQS